MPCRKFKDQVFTELERYRDNPPLKAVFERETQKPLKELVGKYGVKGVKSGRDIIFGNQTRQYKFIFNIDLDDFADASFSAIKNYKESLEKQLRRLTFTTKMSHCPAASPTSMPKRWTS